MHCVRDRGCACQIQHSFIRTFRASPGTVERPRRVSAAGEACARRPRDRGPPGARYALDRRSTPRSRGHRGAYDSSDQARPKSGAAARKAKAVWPVETPSGHYEVALELMPDTLMRVTVTLQPKADLLVAFWPRDLYPLDAHDDPTKAQGRVEAAQRGLNTGLCFFCLDKPAFGNVLYVQNLTALNAYFAATKTKPDGVVGGEWPSWLSAADSAPWAIAADQPAREGRACRDLGCAHRVWP